MYREPVQQAFERWRAKGSVPQTDAVALVRAWLEYESRRSYGVLLPELIAAENRSRYVAAADIRIPVRGGAVIHARLVRPGRVKDPLPSVLRFTLDPAEDDTQRSALKGYVGVTAYVRGREPMPMRTSSGRHAMRSGIAATTRTGTWTASCWAT